MDAHVDASLCSCILLALSAARDAGVAIEPRVFSDALGFVNELTDSVTGRTGRHSAGTPSARVTRINEHLPSDANETLTALALAARLAAGELAKAQPLMAKGARVLLQNPPR